MEKGDIVFLEYDAWVVDIGGDKEDLFDTTDAERAKEGEIFNENEVYKARPFIAGAEGMLKGVGERLLEAEVEKDYEIEIPPEQAYGEKDPKLVEIHSRAEIMRLPEFKDKNDPKVPTPGMEIQLKGKLGRITLVTAGRIRVDFNHRLAGKALKYKYKITGVAKTPEERVRAIIGIYYGREDDFKIEVDGTTAKVVVADLCKYDRMWHTIKIRIVPDLREYAGVETVQLIEEYTKSQAEEQETVEAGVVPAGDEGPEEAPPAQEEKGEGTSEEE